MDRLLRGVSAVDGEADAGDVGSRIAEQKGHRPANSHDGRYVPANFSDAKADRFGS